MRLTTLVEMGMSGRLGLMARTMRGAGSFYRLAFLAGAARCGALAALRDGARTSPELLRDLRLPSEGAAAFDAWLETGVRLGVLDRKPEGLTLRDTFARALAREENDDVLAFVEEALTLHHALLTETPLRLREGRGFSMADQDGTVIARSSRILEPLIREALDRTLPEEPGARLLEIGCGSGVYLRHSLERRPSMTALGLELQEDRVALLRHVRSALRPGGSLLLTTGCLEGSAAMSILSLWGAATEGCGSLPAAHELERQLAEAGFERVRSESLIPGEAFRAFVARNP